MIQLLDRIQFQYARSAIILIMSCHKYLNQLQYAVNAMLVMPFYA
jgi:hypothetical protein